MPSPTIAYSHQIAPPDHAPDKAKAERAHLCRLIERNDWSSVTKMAERSLAYAVMVLEELAKYGYGWCRDVEEAINDMYH